MTRYPDLVVSSSDAEVLASLVGTRHLPGAETEAANALADALLEARMVPDTRLPEDRVAMNSRVSYREEPDGQRRTVALVHPAQANASAGSISVLSPVGRALLGSKRGSTVAIELPGGRTLAVRVLEVERQALEETA
jgi:regulator of nucleoside diphosphate kinase